MISNDSLQQLCPITFTINDYIIQDEDDVADYIFEIKIDKEEYDNSAKKLKVHAVIYIPELMKSFGWNYAFKSQEDWFNGNSNNYPWEAEPKVNDFKMSWILSFNRFKEIYDENINKWKNKLSLDSLRNEIMKMVNDGYAAYPTSKRKITQFGLKSIDDATLVDHIIKPDEYKKFKVKTAKIKVPLFEKYYFTSAKYEEDGDLDDLYGAIANCSIHFTAKGIMEYIDVSNIEVTITELGVYIRDGFDYVGDQPLGFWSLKNKNVSNNPLLSNSRYVNNESYRAYREDSGKGQDFYRYSTMYIYKPNFKFTL